MQTRGIRRIVESRLITTKLPTNLKIGSNCRVVRLKSFKMLILIISMDKSLL